MKLKRYLQDTAKDSVRDFTSLGNPFLLILISILLIGYKSIFIVLGLIAVEILCTLIKIIYYKERPRKQKHTNLLERIRASSFPSIHTSRASFVFFYLFLITPDMISKIIFLLFPLVVGTTRILLKKHYISDVLGGLMIGILTAYLLAFIS